MEKHAFVQATLQATLALARAWDRANARLLSSNSSQERERILYEQRTLEKQFENLLNACRHCA